MAKRAHKFPGTSTTHIARVISEVDDGVTDSYIMAEKVLPLLSKEMLLKLVAWEIRQYRRVKVRRVEDAADISSVGRSTTTAAGDQPTRAQQTQELFEQTFWTPDDGYVLWGEATIDQHIARADYQRARMDTLEIDAERHEFAAELLRDHGKPNLNKLPKYAQKQLIEEFVEEDDEEE